MTSSPCYCACIGAIDHRPTSLGPLPVPSSSRRPVCKISCRSMDQLLPLFPDLGIIKVSTWRHASSYPDVRKSRRSARINPMPPRGVLPFPVRTAKKKASKQYFHVICGGCFFITEIFSRDARAFSNETRNEFRFRSPRLSPSNRARNSDKRFAIRHGQSCRSTNTRNSIYDNVGGRVFFRGSEGCWRLRSRGNATKILFHQETFR